MVESVDAILNGTIGWFWPGFTRAKSLNRESESGYLKLNENGLLTLATLDESGGFPGKDGLRCPSLITGATEEGGIVLLDISGVGRKSRHGGSKASVKNYRARSMVAGVDIEGVRSARLRSITAHFLGVSHWMGIETVAEDVEHHPNSNLLKSWHVKVDAIPEKREKISQGREIATSAHWRVGGEKDRRVIYAPVSFTCRSSRAMEVWRLLYPLLRIQDLLSFSYDGFVHADSGLALPDTDDKLGQTPAFWSAHLMRPWPGVLPPKSLSFPYLTCNTLGGFAGLRRWLSLCDNHLRAVRPIIERYRQGKTSPPIRLMEIAAGMEYWVAAHKRDTKWANARPKGRKHGCGFAWVLSQKVGAPFKEWVSDDHKWAEKFWKTYNQIKHEPAYVPDEYELRVLADSGYLLLASALLNRVANSSAPSRQIFGHRTWQLQEETRKLLR